MRSLLKPEFFSKLFWFLLLLILLLDDLLVLHYNMTIILFEFLFPPSAHSVYQFRLNYSNNMFKRWLRSQGELNLRFHFRNKCVCIIFYLSLFRIRGLTFFFWWKFLIGVINHWIDFGIFSCINNFAIFEGIAMVY